LSRDRCIPFTTDISYQRCLPKLFEAYSFSELQVFIMAIQANVTTWEFCGTLMHYVSYCTFLSLLYWLLAHMYLAPWCRSISFNLGLYISRMLFSYSASIFSVPLLLSSCSWLRSWAYSLFYCCQAFRSVRTYLINIPMLSIPRPGRSLLWAFQDSPTARVPCFLLMTLHTAGSADISPVSATCLLPLALSIQG
jgi:hypothetical protein